MRPTPPITLIQPNSAAPSARRALTLVEMFIVVLLIGVGLFLLIGWARGLRANADVQLTRRVLFALDQALAQYHAAENAYPPTHDDDPQPVITALIQAPMTRRLADSIPTSLWQPSTPRILLDAWGTPLRYVPEAHELAKAHDGRPIFVSAGPDRAFGGTAEQPNDDEIRSDDPRPEGFTDQPSPGASKASPTTKSATESSS